MKAHTNFAEVIRGVGWVSILLLHIILPELWLECGFYLWDRLATSQWLLELVYLVYVFGWHICLARLWPIHLIHCRCSLSHNLSLPLTQIFCTLLILLFHVSSVVAGNILETLVKIWLVGLGMAIEEFSLRGIFHPSLLDSWHIFLFIDTYLQSHWLFDSSSRRGCLVFTSFRGHLHVDTNLIFCWNSQRKLCWLCHKFAFGSSYFLHWFLSLTTWLQILSHLIFLLFIHDHVRGICSIFRIFGQIYLAYIIIVHSIRLDNRAFSGWLQLLLLKELLVLLCLVLVVHNTCVCWWQNNLTHVHAMIHIKALISRTGIIYDACIVFRICPTKSIVELIC